MTSLPALTSALLVATAAALPGAASAQAPGPSAAPVVAAPVLPEPAPAPAPRLVRLVVGGAITAGGDRIASVPLSDGSTRSVSAGGLLDAWVGVEVRPAGGPFAALATLGWHVDCVCASNGDVTFSRVPFELIGLYEFAPRWRAGIGYRHTSDVRLRSGGSAPGYAQDFDDANGVLVQGEWMATPRLGIVVRAVSEKYGYTQTYVNANDQIVTQHLKKDGTHGGVGLNWYF